MVLRKGNKYLIFVIAIFAALPPFAIDTYLPAFGNISDFFGISTNSVATSISSYFFGFAIGMLIWGALSDRFGRKKCLIAGMFIYMISTILCSISKDYSMLVFMRFIQGLGDSSGAVVSMAIIRDCYSGRKLTVAIATMTMVFMVAPIVSPMIGSMIIYLTGEWQAILHFLTCYGVFLFILSFFIPETLNSSKKSKSVLNNISIYIMHSKNFIFLLSAVAAGLSFSALFTFISSSSVLIIDYGKYGYITFCFLFAINLVGVILANFFIKNKLNKSNQYKLVFLGYAIASTVLSINLILSEYVTSNIILFVLINATATIGFSLISSITTSKSLNQLRSGFGSGNALSNLIKFSLASFASYNISGYVGAKLMTHIPLQQLLLIVVSFVIFISIKNRLRD